MIAKRGWACILGHPVKHSLSPAMHNAAFRSVGVDAEYLLVDAAPEELPAAVGRMRQGDCLGGNVTAPHKLAVMPLLDELSEEASALGAVNTVVNRSGRLLGDNTDARGLGEWMSDVGAPLANADCVVIGAGGAARSSVVALARLGAARVTVANRTFARAESLVSDLRPLARSTELRSLPLAALAEPGGQPARVIVNATSLGHAGSAPVVHGSWWAGADQPWAIDLAYNPPVTVFMRDARAAGARAENGLGMLIGQALIGFELWTGLRPAREVFARAALAALPPESDGEMHAVERAR